MQKHLGITVDPLVELVVRHHGLVESDVVRDDEGGLGVAGDDQVACIISVSV